MYETREAAGEVLAEAVAALDLTDPVVFALPRGGVPVALPVAKVLGAPLDLMLVRKIGLPMQPELAAGALVDGPPEHIVWNEFVLSASGLSEADLQDIVIEERAKNADRRRLWLKGRAPIDVTGRSAVVVDDGIATGATMKAALKGLRERGPKEIVLAVPVAAADTLEEMRTLAEYVVCPLVPDYFRAVGLHYRKFGQVADDEVAAMMAAQNKE
ncbi:phosphoribosyltransferase [Marimonas arenosa]|uniref:Phosphoribosyltransferase n=1 Tax=Marimonas arenosa TaxID=1795305 RepID=A0AAE4B425_9RHOB|nr:phosphoribosyltransferase family protein [Marimonas arenosa]MDQ2089797.1 phosphoribosyltransferase [Marimonas arenosa]